MANETDKKVPLGKEGRETLIASVTDVLKGESDQVLESVAEVVQDLRQNVCMREAFESFHQNGWAFIQRTEKAKNEIQLEETSSSLVMNKQNNLTKAMCRLDQETHPMHNELILKKLFEWCSVDTLKNCRLVSTKWRDLSLNSWRGKAVLLGKRLTDGAVEDLVKRKSGFQFQETPFKRYRMDYLLYFHAKPNSIGRQLLHVFFSSAEYLDLTCDDFATMTTMLLGLFNPTSLRVLTLQFSLNDLFREYERMSSENRECRCRGDGANEECYENDPFVAYLMPL